MPAPPADSLADPGFLERSVDRLRAADPRLGAWIDAIGPCAIAVRNDTTPFEALLASIVHQQLAGRAAAAIHARVLALFGGRRPSARHLLERVAESDLRAAGLSEAKKRSVLDLAAKTVDGTVARRARLERLPDDAVVERLTAVRGVGRWTVEMFLLFHLGRPDVLPVDDYGVRQGLGRVLGRVRALPSRRLLAARGERWRPARSVATWYLWRAAEATPEVAERARRLLAERGAATPRPPASSGASR